MKLWKIVFAIWVALWLVFLIRDFVKKEFKEFKTLCFADREAKIDYILGKELNIFLESSINQMPGNSTFTIKGDLDEHDRFRLVYYLYPRLESADPDYILNIHTKSATYELKKIK